MKKGKQWALLLCTLLLMAAGAAMPYMVSAVQEARIENLRESRQLNEVSLTLQRGEDVQEALRLLAGSTNDLVWRGKTKMTEEEAGGAAVDVLRQMNESGLIALPPSLAMGEPLQYESNIHAEPQINIHAEPQINIHAEPQIIMSMDERSLSAVVWICWLDEIAYNFIFIDDDTGKMVRCLLDETGFIMPDSSANHSAAGWNTDLEEATKLAEQWRVFLSAYYGITLVFAAGVEVFDDGYSTQFPLAFDSGEGTDSGVVMRLDLHGTAVFFNLS